MIKTAKAYLDAELSVIPVAMPSKRPGVSAWKPYQQSLPTHRQADFMFEGAEGIAIIAGAVSGGVEVLDFDCGGEAFGPWSNAVASLRPDLYKRLVIERSISGGYHVVYRVDEFDNGRAPGSQKLAQKHVQVQSEASVYHRGKSYKPRLVDDRYIIQVPLIETKGEGGYFVCAPTEGYELTQGDLTALPLISRDERDLFFEVAYRHDQMPAQALNSDSLSGASASPIITTRPGERPGDQFNQCGDIRPVLRKHGWRQTRAGDNEHWCRPGKSEGTSATLKDGVFYVFSTSAAPFEGGRGYSLFAAYALLEHNGDFYGASRQLRTEGYEHLVSAPLPGPRIRPETGGVDLTGMIDTVEPVDPPNDAPSVSAPATYRELAGRCPKLRKPVIHGLLRQGETMNVIAAPKTGKSWLVLDLALSIATGQNWLDAFECEQGKVLIIDNELHPETTANRIPRVAKARRMPVDTFADRILIDNVRGRMQDLYMMGPYFEQFQPGDFKLIILDAFYRFLPMRVDENDNGTMANLYNYIDGFASRLQCSFVLIHHTSKGNQSAKSVTDVGAGAGSQSRATDTHLVLRQHDEDDAVVLDAAVRSWKPIASRCLRWEFPVWEPADELDPTALAGKANGKTEAKTKRRWTPEEFVDEVLSDTPQNRLAIIARANNVDITDYHAKKLLASAEAVGLAYRWRLSGNQVGYATTKQSAEGEADDGGGLNKRQRIRQILKERPDISLSDLAKQARATKSYASTVRRDLNMTGDTDATNDTF